MGSPPCAFDALALGASALRTRRVGAFSGRPDLLEKGDHIGPKRLGLLAELGRGVRDLLSRGAGLRRRLIDAANVAGHLVSALGGLLRVARDLAGRGTLLLHRGSDG